MKVYSGFNADVLKRIAIAADNSQLKRDVGYASFLHHHNPQSIYCERIDDIAFIICQKQKQQMRIIGMGTAAQYKGKGLASILLKRCIEKSRALGFMQNEALMFWECVVMTIGWN